MKDFKKEIPHLRPWLSHSYKYLLISLFFFFSCGQKDISGTWKGLSIYENGEEMSRSKADLCSLHIDDGAYFFRGNTGLIEKGLINQKKKVLYLRDTLRERPTKQIAYKLIGSDSLELIMNDNSNELRLLMQREKQ